MEPWTQSIRVVKWEGWILFKCLLYVSPLLLVWMLIYYLIPRRKQQPVRRVPPSALDVDENRPKEPLVAKQRPAECPKVPPPELLGYDPRDRVESWDRERRRRYGRHQHKHGRHHGWSSRQGRAAPMNGNSA